MHRRRERGAFTVYVAMAGLVATMLLAAIVDFNGQVNAKQHAQAIAAQAGRAAGQAVDPRSLLGGRVRLDKVAARRAAEAYLRRQAIPATVSFVGTAIEVRVNGRYRTQLLGMVGIGSLPVRASARAELVPH